MIPLVVESIVESVVELMLGLLVRFLVGTLVEILEVGSMVVIRAEVMGFTEKTNQIMSVMTFNI